MILEIHYLQSDSKEKVEILGHRCVLGRSPNASYQIDLECFSRKHLEIEIDDNDFFVTDLNSTNGVHINGEKIIPGLKTKFQNFFPIEVNGKVAIYVHLSEGNIENSKPVQKSTGQTSFTATKKLNASKVTSISSKTSARAKTKNEVDSSPNWKKVLPIIAGVFVLFYFFNRSDEQGESEDLQIVSQTQTLSEVKPITSPQIQLNPDELKELMKDDKCSSSSYFCKKINLIYPEEKYVQTEDKIILYVNISEQVKNLKSPFMDGQKDNEKAEFILASFAFNPEILLEASSQSLKYLVIVGIDPVEGLLRMKYAMVGDVSQTPKLESVEYKNFFSGLFHGGIYRPYKVGLKPHVQFTIF